jgi:hypothetical protein
MMNEAVGLGENAIGGMARAVGLVEKALGLRHSSFVIPWVFGYFVIRNYPRRAGPGAVFLPRITRICTDGAPRGSFSYPCVSVSSVVSVSSLCFYGVSLILARRKAFGTVGTVSGAAKVKVR